MSRRSAWFGNASTMLSLFGPQTTPVTPREIKMRKIFGKYTNIANSLSKEILVNNNIIVFTVDGKDVRYTLASAATPSQLISCATGGEINSWSIYKNSTSSNEIKDMSFIDVSRNTPHSGTHGHPTVGLFEDMGVLYFHLPVDLIPANCITFSKVKVKFEYEAFENVRIKLGELGFGTNHGTSKEQLSNRVVVLKESDYEDSVANKVDAPSFMDVVREIMYQISDDIKGYKPYDEFLEEIKKAKKERERIAMEVISAERDIESHRGQSVYSDYYEFYSGAAPVRFVIDKNILNQGK